MAFFSDGTSDFFSLALRPSNPERHSVFRVGGAQMTACRSWFAAAAPASIVTSVTLVALLAAPTELALSTSTREHVVVVCVAAALIFYMGAVSLFFWIRTTSGASVEGKVATVTMSDLTLERGVSLALYGTCLLSLLAPPLGLLALSGTLRPDQDAVDWAGRAPLAVIAVGVFAMIAFCIARVVAIIRTR